VTQEGHIVRPSNVCFVVAGTVLLLHQLLFDMMGGYGDIEHNAMTGLPALMCYIIAGGVAFTGWRLRVSERR